MSSERVSRYTTTRDKLRNRNLIPTAGNIRFSDDLSIFCRQCYSIFHMSTLRCGDFIPLLHWPYHIKAQMSTVRDFANFLHRVQREDQCSHFCSAKIKISSERATNLTAVPYLSRYKTCQIA